MTDALRAEWTKLRTLGATGWLVIATVGLTVGVSAAVAATTHVSRPGGQDPTKLALIGIDLGQAVAAVLAVLAVSEEYGTGLIRVTLSAVPRRPVVLAAKAATVAGVVVLAGLLAVAGCLLVGRLMLPGAGIDPAHGDALVSIADGPTLRAALGSVVYLVLVALLCLGVATMTRDTAVSIGATLGLLYLPPLLAVAVGEPLRRHVEQVAPMSAGLAIQATTGVRGLPIAPWAGLGVLAAWAGTALCAGGLTLSRRDA
jgi:ABC-2 type transport system permease protein